MGGHVTALQLSASKGTANFAIPIIQDWYRFWPQKNLGTGRCLAAGGAGGPGDKPHAKRSRDSHTRFNDREDWVLGMC